MQKKETETENQVKEKKKTNYTPCHLIKRVTFAEVFWEI